MTIGYRTWAVAMPTTVDDPRSERDSLLVELREAAASIRRHVRWVAASVIACVVAALMLATVRPPVYVSTAQVLLDPRGLNITENEIVPRPPSADVNDAIIETQLRLLTSDDVLKSVVARLGLAQDPDYAARPGLLARLGGGLFGQAPPARAQDPVVVATALLGQAISFQREGKSFVVTVSVRAADAAKAARIASEVVRTFVADLERRRRDIVVQAREGLAATLKSQNERLAKVEDSVERYKKRIGVTDADGRAMNTARLSELGSQLLAARGNTRTLASRAQQLESLRKSGGATAAGSGAGDVVESTLLTQLKVNFAEVSRQRDNLRATLGPRHPQVGEIEAQVRSLSRAIGQEVDRLYAAAQSEYKGALAREESLGRDIARAEADTVKTNTALVALRQLEREAGAQRSVYERSLSRERELLEQEGVRGTNAAVVSDAKLAPGSVGLRPGLLVVAAFGLGLVLGSALAVIVDRLRGRVYSVARLSGRTGLDVIGILPMARPRQGGRASIASLLAPSGSTATSRALFRVIDALEAGRPAQPGRLLVVSASAGPARGVIASSLVLAQASRGRKTLLVDADARSGHLNRLVPRGEPATVVDCTVEGYPPFGVTAADIGAPGAWESDPFAGLADGYECVVIDAGHGIDEVGLRRLAAASTAILVVTEGGVTTLAEIEDLKASLMTSADKVLGALLVVPGRDAAVPMATKILMPPTRRIGHLSRGGGEFA